MMDQLIFVVGAPRSGTTYLARALSLARDVAYWEESEFFTFYGPRRFPQSFARALQGTETPVVHAWTQTLLRGTDALRGVDRLTRLVEHMLRHTKLKSYDLRPSNPLVDIQSCVLNEADHRMQRELVARYRIIEKTGLAAVCEAVLQDFVRLRGRRHLLEKTPDHLLMTPVIRSVFPQAKFVMIRRSKRDALASYIRTFNLRRMRYGSFMSGRTLLNRLVALYGAYDRMENTLQGQSWCRSVSYVDMVERPYETIGSVLNWLNLSMDESRCRALFMPRPASSQWDQLSDAQQRVIERHFQKICR
jgi:hypothetical protein